MIEKIPFTYVYEQLEIIRQNHSAITDYFVNQQSLGNVYETLTERKSTVPTTNTFLQRILQRISAISHQTENI